MRSTTRRLGQSTSLFIASYNRNSNAVKKGSTPTRLGCVARLVTLPKWTPILLSVHLITVSHPPAMPLRAVDPSRRKQRLQCARTLAQWTRRKQQNPQKSTTTAQRHPRSRVVRRASERQSTTGAWVQCACPAAIPRTHCNQHRPFFSANNSSVLLWPALCLWRPRKRARSFALATAFPQRLSTREEACPRDRRCVHCGLARCTAPPEWPARTPGP